MFKKVNGLMHNMHTIIDVLDLKPHPEGGFFKEVHRSKTIVHGLKSSSNKNAYTSIYYLLPGQSFSAWHRIKSDETWYFHYGCDLALYYFDEHKLLHTVTLGIESIHLQITIPANTWFAAKPLDKDTYCLVSCAVAPGFEFDDFEIASRNHLLKEFGSSAENIQVIEALTRV